MGQPKRSPFTTGFPTGNPWVVLAVGLALIPRSLAQEHSPANDTAAREAYESDLIRTRHPRFNVAP